MARNIMPTQTFIIPIGILTPTLPPISAAKHQSSPATVKQIAAI
jgi:hypothetical protein